MQDVIDSVTGFISDWLPLSRGSVGKGGAGAAGGVREVVVVKEMLPTAGQAFVRLAGLSGAVAVAMGAYGAHVFRPGHPDPAIVMVFETGNRYHFLHTLALLAVPLTRRPLLVGSLLMAGMLLFSGSCYAHALTGNPAFRQATPYGGMLLIAAWLAILI